MTDDEDTHVDGPTTEQVHFRQDIKNRKRKNVKKNQPWRAVHKIDPSDIPQSSDILFDKPWFNEDEFGELQDSTFGA